MGEYRTFEGQRPARHTLRHLLLRSLFIVSITCLSITTSPSHAAGSVTSSYTYDNFHFAATAQAACGQVGYLNGYRVYWTPTGVPFTDCPIQGPWWPYPAGGADLGGECLLWVYNCDVRHLRPTLSCPANSATNGSQCICAPGFQPDAAGTQCVAACTINNTTPSNDPNNPCTCNPGYEWDATHTSCVPTCPISDLPPISDPEVQAFEDNPTLVDTARLDPKMQSALACLVGAATSAVGVPPTIGSAYRPPAYNQHLAEVWEKWNEFEEAQKDSNTQVTDNQSCLALKTKILAHFRRHKLLTTQPPVINSRHTKGLAVDVTINLTEANIDALARGCGLYRPLPKNDRVHFQLP